MGRKAWQNVERQRDENKSPYKEVQQKFVEKECLMCRKKFKSEGGVLWRCTKCRNSNVVDDSPDMVLLF